MGPCGTSQSECRQRERRGSGKRGFRPQRPVSAVEEQKPSTAFPSEELHPNVAQLAHPEFILRNYYSANRLESCSLLPANLHTITNDNWEPFRPG